MKWFTRQPKVAREATRSPSGGRARRFRVEPRFRLRLDAAGERDLVIAGAFSDAGAQQGSQTHAYARRPTDRYRVGRDVPAAGGRGDCRRARSAPTTQGLPELVEATEAGIRDAMALESQVHAANGEQRDILVERGRVAWTSAGEKLRELLEEITRVREG